MKGLAFVIAFRWLSLLGVQVFEVEGWTTSVRSYRNSLPVLITGARFARHGSWTPHSSRLFAAVPDPDEWIQWASNSLEKATGQSILDRMEEDCNDEKSSFPKSIRDIHASTRYCVLSHDNADDPIFNYMNSGAMEQFKWTTDEVYTIPSRMTAPEGKVRDERQEFLQEAEASDVMEFTDAIRHDKFGKQFLIQKGLYFSVYNNEGNLVGYAAMFDRNETRRIDQ